MTETVSGCDCGTPLDLNALTRLWNDGDLSRILKVSGVDSRDADADGDGVFPVSELARSAIEGDLVEPRTLFFLPTEKNAELAGVGLAFAVGSGDKVENFSSALILCEIPEPRLTFLAVGLLGSELIRFKYAEDADTDLGVATSWDEVGGSR